MARDQRIQRADGCASGLEKGAYRAMAPRRGIIEGGHIEDGQEPFKLQPKMGNPPALPGDWKSLTFQGVHQEASSREPPST